MLDIYDPRPLKTYGVVLEDKDGNKWVKSTCVLSPFSKAKSLRLDFTNRVGSTIYTINTLAS